MILWHNITKLILLALMLLPSSLHATTTPKQTTIRFAVNTPGSAPYLYYDVKTGKYQGVVVDFFNTIAPHKITVSYLDSNRARSEQLLHTNAVDTFLSSPNWLEHPNDFIYSSSLMRHDSYMYKTAEFSEPFDAAKVNGSSVCTRYGFVYPVLQPFFDMRENGLIRVNSSSQETMAIMLTKGRCEFAIMSEQNARSVMFKEKFCSNTFYQSPNVIHGVDLVFVLRPELVEVQAIINEALTKFVNSGARDEAFRRHSGDASFPKGKCQRAFCGLLVMFV